MPKLLSWGVPSLVILFTLIITLLLAKKFLFTSKQALIQQVTNSEQISSPSGSITTTIKPTIKPTVKKIVSPTPTVVSTTPALTPTITLTPTISSPTPTPTYTFTPPTVKVTYPNGGETFTEGQNINITWEASGIFSSFVIQRTDCPSCASNIATVNGMSRSYGWSVDVGNTTNTKFKIKIISYPTNYSPNPVDESDNFFTVHQN